MSADWLLGYDREANYHYWFRLSRDKDDWNAADLALEERILGTRVEDRIVRATYDATNNIFLGAPEAKMAGTNGRTSDRSFAKR